MNNRPCPAEGRVPAQFAGISAGNALLRTIDRREFFVSAHNINFASEPDGGPRVDVLRDLIPGAWGWLQFDARGRYQALFERRWSAPQEATLLDGSNLCRTGENLAAGVAGYRPRALFGAVADLAWRGINSRVICDGNLVRLFNDARSRRIWSVLRGHPAVMTFLETPGSAADETLLREAVKKGQPIVTNDQFRDWEGQFTELRDPGWREQFLVPFSIAEDVLDVKKFGVHARLPIIF